MSELLAFGLDGSKITVTFDLANPITVVHELSADHRRTLDRLLGEFLWNTFGYDDAVWDSEACVLSEELRSAITAVVETHGVQSDAAFALSLVHITGQSENCELKQGDLGQPVVFRDWSFRDAILGILEQVTPRGRNINLSLVRGADGIFSRAYFHDWAPRPTKLELK